jgi:hypothetical protein
LECELWWPESQPTLCITHSVISQIVLGQILKTQAPIHSPIQELDVLRAFTEQIVFQKVCGLGLTAHASHSCILLYFLTVKSSLGDPLPHHFTDEGTETWQVSGLTVTSRSTGLQNPCHKLLCYPLPWWPHTVAIERE